jgi:hypothetical protein
MRTTSLSLLFMRYISGQHILSSTQNPLTDVSNLDTAQSQNVTSECPMNFECQLTKRVNTRIPISHVIQTRHCRGAGLYHRSNLNLKRDLR